MPKEPRNRKPKSKGKEPSSTRLPETPEELAEYVDTHSLGESLDEFEVVTETFQLAPELEKKIRERAEERFKKTLISLRLENRQIEDAKQIAREKGLAYQTMMRVWIQEGIERARKESSRKKRSAA